MLLAVVSDHDDLDDDDPVLVSGENSLFWKTEFHVF
jgi:hypothetical protein